MSKNYDLQDYEKYFEDINKLIYPNLDGETIEYISSQVKQTVFSKFHQMKQEGYLRPQQNPNKTGFIWYSLALVFSSVIVAFGIVTLIILQNSKDIQTSYNLDNNKIEVSSVNSQNENIRLSTSNGTLFIYLPEAIEGIISISPSTEVKSVVVYIGDTSMCFKPVSSKSM